MTISDQELEILAHSLSDALLNSGARVTCVESCTGGWVSKVLTDVPGSSAWFGWGFVTYSSAAKQGALNLSEDILSKHGAVSESAVVSMAKKALDKAGAEFSVAVSGIAGPDGGTEDKPVGTVWFAWIGPQTIRAECCHFDGNRESVRRKSVARALEGLLVIVEQDA